MIVLTWLQAKWLRWDLHLERLRLKRIRWEESSLQGKLADLGACRESAEISIAHLEASLHQLSRSGR